MADAGSGKEHIRRAERLSRVTAHIFAAARGDKIDFITSVRILRVVATRRIYLDQQGAVFENSSEALTFGTWKMFERFGD